VNIKEYISSGIIESYVLGLATEAERREFESMCSSYPEIAEARNSFELSLESQLQKGAIEPPAHLKQTIQEKISSSPESQTVKKEEVSQAPIRRLNPWKWIAAALFLIMAGSLIWSVNINKKLQERQEENTALQHQLRQSTAQLDSIKADMDMLHKPDVKMAALHSPANPAMYATIYWDTTNKDVYLMVNNLPQPATGKQYQLWALLNGKPIDLGVIVKQERLLVRMKGVQEAQAFAITVEPSGGSTLPTSNPVVLSRL
jgi:anti-sigma-K factor RskA